MQKIKSILSLLDKINKPVLWLIIILIVGFAVRLYKINIPLGDWHSWRQADTAAVSRIFKEEGINILEPKYYDISTIQSGFFNPNGWRMVELPLFNIFHVAFSYMLPFVSFETAGRLMSIVTSLITSLILYSIGKETISKWGGVLASFFYLLIPFNIYFTRVILPEPLVVLFATGAIWLFLRFDKTNKNIYFILSAILAALGLLLKPYSIFYSLPIILIAIRKYKEKIYKNAGVVSKMLIYLNIATLPFLIWRIWINQFPVGIPHFEWAFNGDGIRFRPAFWRWIFGERIGKLILGMWGLIPFGVGSVLTKNKKLINVAFMVGVVLYTIVVATANVRHDYYQTLLMPAIALILSQGSLYLWNEKNLNLVLRRGLVLFSAVMMIGIGAYQVKDYYQVNHPEIITAGEAVDRLTPKDALVVAPYNGDTAFLYQTKRYGWPVVETTLDQLINEFGADYYVSVDLNSADTLKFEEKYSTLEKTGEYIILDLNQPK